MIFDLLGVDRPITTVRLVADTVALLLTGQEHYCRRMEEDPVASRTRSGMRLDSGEAVGLLEMDQLALATQVGCTRNTGCDWGFRRNEHADRRSNHWTIDQY